MTFDIHPDDPISVEAASFARSLVKASIDGDTDFRAFLWGQVTAHSPRIIGGQPGETEEQLYSRKVWETAFMASLAHIAAVAVISATRNADGESDTAACARYLECMEIDGQTF